LYQWQLGGGAPTDIRKQLAEHEDFAKADDDYLAQLLDGTVAQAAALEQDIAPALDRKVGELSPVERGILLLAAWELRNAPEVPYRVVINEAIELAKAFGGTDGYKFVNGVLDKLAPRLRPHEKRG
jgi:N utilization substance protein B